MTDTTIKDKPTVPLFVRIVSGILASGATSLILTMCSMSGTNFELAGVNSELIKASITGSLTGIFVAPECIPLAIAGFIISFRLAWRTVANAFTRQLPEDQQ